jgi:hypothetical protein
LRWTTLSERGNDGFVIEKSNDGQHFEYAGFVKGVGTTTQKQNYSFPDHTFARSAYYRLAQYDDNGKVNYSNTIFLSLSRQGNVSFNLYPNPAHEAVTLTMQGQLNNETLQLQVVATDGRTISFTQGTMQDLNKELNAIVGSLAQGVYMLKITSETDVQILRLVKE